MDRGVTALGLVVAAALAIGCTSQNSTPTASVPAKADIAGAQAAVHEFLEAVRTGDDVKAANMLTNLARQKTSERDLVVAPPGSPQASFKVGQAEKVTDDGAHVQTEWSDVDGEGNRHSDTILWVLRCEPEGWRIAGMITKVFPELEPIVLNFEDPDDMVMKQRLAEEEFARRTEQKAPATGAPGATAPPGQTTVIPPGQATGMPPAMPPTQFQGQPAQEQGPPAAEAKTPMPVNRLR